MCVCLRWQKEFLAEVLSGTPIGPDKGIAIREGREREGRLA